MKGEFEERIQDLYEQVTNDEGRYVDFVPQGEILEILEDLRVDFPKYCSGWKQRPELLGDPKGCWNCIFDLHCPMPAFFKKWLRKEGSH